jgi:hypothetical protein
VGLFLRRAIDSAADAAENLALSPFARYSKGFPPLP